MIIRSATAIIAAIFLVTIFVNKSNANEFCGERYCGQFEPVKTQKHYKKHKQYKHITPISYSYAYGSLVNKAENYLGTNPTGWKHVWCGRFMAMIAPDKASRIKNPNRARDWGTLPGAHKYNGIPGEIVVLSRGRGGHVGVLKGYDGHGNPIIISGNHGRSVGVGVYPAYRVIAYVPS